MPKKQTQTQDESQMNRRAGFKWSINECLKLEREYGLLKMSLDDIALLHERSVDAIMYKLDKEGIADYTQLYIETYGYGNESDNDSVTDSDSDNDDACSENSDEEYEEDCQEENSDSDEEDQDPVVDEDEEEYDSYNLKQQVQILTKQLASLTAVVYKSLSWGKSEKKLSVNC